MPGTAVIQSGNYELNIDTGFPQDAFILDSATAGILGGYGTIQTAQNILLNPNFEFSTPTSRWSAGPTGGTISGSTSGPYSGSTFLNIQSDSTIVAQFAYPITLTSPEGTCRAVNGDVFRVSAYFKNIAGLDRTVRIGVQKLIENGNDSGSPTFVASTALTVGSGWTLLEGTYTASGMSASIPYIRFQFYNQSNLVEYSLSNVTGLDAVCITQTSATRPYFDGSLSEPYPGYTIMSQNWVGTVNRSPSNIQWGLNSSYVDSDYVLDGSTNYANVMDSVTNITIKRGRQDTGDQFSAGTMSFTILDTSGVFNPFDQNSPFYDNFENIPGLAPLRAVNVKRYDSTDTAETIFSGYVVNYDYNFALGGLDTVTVYCADQFYLLSQTELDAYNPVAETSGERIETILDLPEVDFPAAARNIETGVANLGHDSSYNIPAGTNVLSYISQINDTAEFGRVFMSRDGVFTFQSRLLGTLDLPVASFKDDGTAYSFDGVGITFEADAVVNRAVVTGLNNNTATANDLSSQTTYFIQNESIGNSLLHLQSEIDTAASYLLNPLPEPRYTSVQTKFLMLTAAQKDVLATLDIGDTILISKTFPSGTGTTTLAQDLSIEGITHRINLDDGHQITYFTAGTIILHELILDDATYGTLDSDNALR